MNKRILLIYALIIGLSVCAQLSANAAKQLPALYELMPGRNSGIVPASHDYNVLVEHLLEDERIIKGLQEQVSKLHTTKADRAELDITNSVIQKTRDQVAHIAEHLHKEIKR